MGSIKSISTVLIMMIFSVMIGCSSDPEVINKTQNNSNGEEVTEYDNKMNSSLRRELRRQKSENISEVVSVLLRVDKEMAEVDSELERFRKEMEKSDVEIRTVAGHIISIRATPEVLHEIMKDDRIIGMEKSEMRSRR